MSAQQQAVALRLFLLPGDKDGVLGITRGMVRRKIQRFKIEIVGLDLRAVGNGVAHGAEDLDDFVHGAQDRMLGAHGTVNAGKGDVEFSGDPIPYPSDLLFSGNPSFSILYGLFDPRGKIVNCHASSPLLLRRGALKPKIDELSLNPVLAGQPPVTECSILIDSLNGLGFGLKRLQEGIRFSTERFLRIILEFFDGVCHSESRGTGTLACASLSLCRP